MVKHELHQVPVTALAFSKDHLFAGEGPVLRIYSRHDHELIESITVFSSQAIHGITIHSSGIIVWGGRLVTLYVFTSADYSILSRFSSFEAADWILDIAVSPEVSGKKQKAALITAHNALLLLELDWTTDLQELTSNSRCILYSAHIHWITATRILVSSGTVFGDIIVWSCSLQENSVPSSVLHHVLIGHEGSIFGVQIFEDTSSESEKKPTRLLASCSDDRTIRIWDISSLPNTATDPQAAADLTSARETGFGANVADVLPDNTSGGRCIARGWGHASRIWGVKFIPSHDPKLFSYVVSFGEDATHQFWSLGETSPDQFALTHLGGSCLHSGKNIWSWAIDHDMPGEAVIASGGADGGIALEPKSIPFTNESDHTQTWSIQDLGLACPERPQAGRQDKLRSYAFLDKTNLLVTTDAGNILLLTEDEKGHARTDWIRKEEMLRGYSVVTSIPSLSIAFLAGMDGSVMLYQGKEVKELVKSTRKTAALFAQQLASSNDGCQQIGLLTANVEAKTALFTCFGLSVVAGDNQTIKNLFTWRLVLPKGFVITSFIAVNLGQEEGWMLVLGSRSGSIAVYQVRDKPNIDEDVAHQYLLAQAHGFEAVTDLAWYAGPNLYENSGHIFSVGRDGTYAIHHLSNSDPAIDLRLIGQTTLPLGTNIEGVHIDEETQHLIVWGFHSRQFIVFDATEEVEILNIDCGGANRVWKFVPEGLRGGHFVWTKASQLCLFSQVQNSTRVLNKGGHGREIKSLAVAPSSPAKSGILFATGSEDTDIKLMTYQAEDKLPHFRCLKTLRKHNTGIRQLEWSSDGHYLFSSAGFEEFFVWRVDSAPLVELGVVCESACPTESELPDLRIMSFSCREESGNFVITMVRSDSTLRMYQYCRGQKDSWSILKIGNYLTSCLTQCLHIETFDQTQSLITAGTDGYVAFFPLQTERSAIKAEPSGLKWIHRAKIHQNTIHSMKLHWLDDKTCLLLTGGDDNAVAFTVCAWSAAQETPKVNTVIVPRAHTAAVTGVEVLASSDPSQLTVATTSIDQRVKIWKLSWKDLHTITNVILFTGTLCSLASFKPLLIFASHAHEEDLPGTVNLQALEGDDTAYGQALYPVPSEDPNDPLQWSKSKKTMILIIVSLYSFLGNSALVGPSVYLEIYSKEFGISVTEASGLVSYPNLVFGFGSLLLVPAYLKFGRRPILLLSLLMFVFGLLGASQATSYGGLMAARIIHALGSGVCEALPVQLVNDIFFLHERGKRLGYYTVCLCWGSTGPLYAGYMLAAGYSWRLYFYVEFAFACALLILAFVFVEESSYKRVVATTPTPDSDKEKGHVEHVEVVAVAPPRRSWLQTLKPWSGIDHEAEFFMTMLRSFSYFLVPSVLWVVTSFGIYIGLGALTFNYTFPIKIVAPPYNWNPKNSGLIALGNIIGYALAVPFASSSDRIAAWLTKRNNSIREAEMRLWVLLPVCLIAPAGLILYGFTAQNNLHWIGYFAGVAMTDFVSYFYFSFVLAYAVDSMTANTAEMLIAMNLGKQAISFGMGIYLLEWILEHGAWNSWTAALPPEVSQFTE
ncbi:WD40 repeat-like protein, partial [Aureobasidium melanogenum]